MSCILRIADGEYQSLLVNSKLQNHANKMDIWIKAGYEATEYIEHLDIAKKT